MNKKLTLMIFALFLLLPQLSLAATIKGNVYDFSLNQIEAIVEINTTPSQKIVAKESYEFKVPVGNYLLTAKQMQSNVVVAEIEEFVNINDQGDYVIDLILFPDVGIDDLEFNQPEIVPEDIPNDQVNYPLLLLTILSLFALLWIFSHKPNHKSKETQEFKLDKTAQKVLNFITKHKRTTQKEIRKEFPLSEAKISLIITELEDKGLIKKIKKGRGNVIVRN